MDRQERQSGPHHRAAPTSKKDATTNSQIVRRESLHAIATAEYAPPLPAHRRCTIAVRCCHCGYIECRFAEIDELLAGQVVRRCRRTGLRYRVVVTEAEVVAA